MLFMVLGVSWKDKVSNDVIYGELPNLSDKIKSMRLASVTVIANLNIFNFNVSLTPDLTRSNDAFPLTMINAQYVLLTTNFGFIVGLYKLGVWHDYWKVKS
jgi:hypothetical protein